MKTPEFVAVLLGSLLLDLVLLGSLIFVPFLVYHIIMILVLAVPIVVGLQAPACYKWTQQSEGGSPWSALSRILCGSSLIFLLLVSTMFYLFGREPSTWPELLGMIYLNVSFLRFYGAGMLNIPVALLCLVKGNKVDKLASICAILCSGAGLALLNRGPEAQMLQDPGQILFLALMMLLSFAYGLVWGGALNWFLDRLRGPKNSTAN